MVVCYWACGVVSYHACLAFRGIQTVWQVARGPVRCRTCPLNHYSSSFLSRYHLRLSTRKSRGFEGTFHCAYPTSSHWPHIQSLVGRRVEVGQYDRYLDFQRMPCRCRGPDPAASGILHIHLRLFRGPLTEPQALWLAQICPPNPGPCCSIFRPNEASCGGLAECATW